MATNTKTPPEPGGLNSGGRPRFAGRRRSSLTIRILTVNVVAPMVLMVGLLYMSQYRDNLIRAELETLKAQAQLFAGAIAEGAVKPVERGRPFLFAKPEEIEVLIPELSRRMVRRLGEGTDSRTRLFNGRGKLIGDSYQLIRPDGKTEAEPEDVRSFSVAGILRYLGREAIDMLPKKTNLELYYESDGKTVDSFPDALIGMEGKVSATAWQDKKGRIILTAAAPIRKVREGLGVVLLTREGKEIEDAMNQVRFDVVTVFLGALSITIFLSMYLAGIIGRPLKRLARAAQAIRMGQGRTVEIPDLTYRRDEIGELSEALRGMTGALWERMDTIERFAADVSHEIKNPLTSLRSAVETLEVVKNKGDHDRLMEIIKHDIQRMDRLISDISNASRLDAELLRDEMGTVNLNILLPKIAATHQVPLARDAVTPEGGGNTVLLKLADADEDTVVRGNEGRLAQVFDNLLSNALSFSPEGKPVIVSVSPERGQVRVTVEDSGPGIPDNKIETIFERFYTERPKHESYGSHSGLGLSIARQIVRVHGGRIWAENRKDEAGQAAGARFCVLLNRNKG